MARDLRSSNVVDLEVRASALGTELIPCELNGRDVYLTAQQIAALGGLGATITVSESDPGATGPGSGWLLIDASGVSLTLFIRNNADDGWLSDGALPLGALDASVEIVEDLEVGIGQGVFARQVVTPLAVDGGYVTLFSSRFEGDTYPRVLVISDGSIYIGDGSTNPLQGNPQGLFPQSSGIEFAAQGSRVKIGVPSAGDMSVDAGANALTLSGDPIAINSGANVGVDAATIGFFDKAPTGNAQEAYINPASITAQQIGQILIDYGLMAAS